jgi:23S rRNA (uridine2552-2'-O)-methyltransferase
VLSDISPNMSGVDVADQARAMHLAELAQEFAAIHLKPGGAFVVKLFQGRGFDEYVKNLRKAYERVSMRKPKASRARSPEVYALATGKK